MYERAMNDMPLRILEALIISGIGAILVAFIVVFTTTLPSIRFLFEAHTLGPLSEEMLKFAAALGLVRYLKVNPVPLPLLGTAFGGFEALRHLQVYGVIGSGAIMAHIVFGIVMSLFLTAALSAHDSWKSALYSLALVVPATLHFIYNVTIVPHLF